MYSIYALNLNILATAGKSINFSEKSIFDLKFSMDHRSDDEEELWSTPKSLTGAGDGLKTFKHPTVGNTPKKLNSHKVSDKDGKIRKKTPNTVMVKKTEQNRLRKACSIAEITPTKTRTLKKYIPILLALSFINECWRMKMSTA